MWEYACRAGTTTPSWTGETITADQANFMFHHGEATTEVGSFQANPFGVFDMHGNVWEWCSDHWHVNFDGAPTNGLAWLDSSDPKDFVVRGGSWPDPAAALRSAMRIKVLRDLRSKVLGFRCAHFPD